MGNFLFHKVSEKEREEIRKQAKAIMDSFSKKLDKVSDKLAPLGVPRSTEQRGKEPIIERRKCEREENFGGACEIDTLKGTSRKIIFENAPNSNEDFIIAEKKGW